MIGKPRPRFNWTWKSVFLFIGKSIDAVSRSFPSSVCFANVKWLLFLVNCWKWSVYELLLNSEQFSLRLINWRNSLKIMSTLIYCGRRLSSILTSLFSAARAIDQAHFDWFILFLDRFRNNIYMELEFQQSQVSYCSVAIVKLLLFQKRVVKLIQCKTLQRWSRLLSFRYEAI